VTITGGINTAGLALGGGLRARFERRAGAIVTIADSVITGTVLLPSRRTRLR
jgi:hypothetical protein